MAIFSGPYSARDVFESGSQWPKAFRAIGEELPRVALIVGLDSPPYVAAYRWNPRTGIGERYPDPLVTGIPNCDHIEVSPDGRYVIWGSFDSPGVCAYEWDYDTGFGAKVADPSVIIENGAYACAVHPDSNAVAFGTVDPPYVAVYAWSNGFGAKYADPSVPPSDGDSVAFSPDGNAIVMGHFVSPYVSAWPWSSSTGFGTRFANPAVLPLDDCFEVAFSRNGGAVAFIGQGNSFLQDSVSVYQFNSSTGFGAKYSNMSGADPLASNLTFADNAVVFVSDIGSVAYEWDDATGFGDRYSDPSVTTGFAVNATFTPNQDAVAFDSFAPEIKIYRWDSVTGFGVKYPSPRVSTFGGAGVVGIRFIAEPV